MLWSFRVSSLAQLIHHLLPVLDERGALVRFHSRPFTGSPQPHVLTARVAEVDQVGVGILAVTLPHLFVGLAMYCGFMHLRLKLLIRSHLPTPCVELGLLDSLLDAGWHRRQVALLGLLRRWPIGILHVPLLVNPSVYVACIGHCPQEALRIIERVIVKNGLSPVMTRKFPRIEVTLFSRNVSMDDPTNPQSTSVGIPDVRIVIRSKTEQTPAPLIP